MLRTVFNSCLRCGLSSRQSSKYGAQTPTPRPSHRSDNHHFPCRSSFHARQINTPSKESNQVQSSWQALVPRLGHSKTIGVIAHRLCHLIWIILHNGVRYAERGPAVSKQSQQRHTQE
jgi:hypothetical protein